MLSNFPKVTLLNNSNFNPNLGMLPQFLISRCRRDLIFKDSRGLRIIVLLQSFFGKWKIIFLLVKLIIFSYMKLTQNQVYTIKWALQSAVCNPNTLQSLTHCPTCLLSSNPNLIDLIIINHDFSQLYYLDNKVLDKVFSYTSFPPICEVQ